MPYTDPQLPETEPKMPHHTGGLTVAGYDVEKIISYTLLATSILAAAVVLAPLALPFLGIGKTIEADVVKACCNNASPNTGFAEEINELIKRIPVVGTTLGNSTTSAASLLIPAGTILGGYAAGSLVQSMEREAGGTGKVGSGIRVSTMALGSILALPALLPGIAHGVIFLGNLLGTDTLIPNPDVPGTKLSVGPLTDAAQSIGTHACAVLGPRPTPEQLRQISEAIRTGSDNVPYANSAIVGAQSSAALLAGHAGCVVPALFAAGAVGAHAASTKAEKIMAERDAANAAIARG